MVIETIKSLSSDKRARIIGGVYITFQCDETLQDGSYVEVNFKDTMFPFRIVGVDVSKDGIVYTARECGYFAHKIKKVFPNIHYQEFINSPIVVVTDEIKIKYIRESSLWT